MTTILLVDTNYTFTADVESRLILNEIPDLQIVALNNVDDVFRIVQNVQPDKVLLNAAVLEMYPDWNLTIPVISYARNTDSLALAAKHNIPCYGVVDTPETLLTAIENNSFVTIQKEQPKPPQKPELVKKTEPVKKTQQTFTQEEEFSFDDHIVETAAPKKREYVKEDPITSEKHAVYKEQMVSDRPSFQEAEPQKPAYQPPKQETGNNAFDLRAQLAQAKEEERRLAKKQQEEQARRDRQQISEQLERKKGKAKVITVYSAKGGVGKTTISCELAVYLALTDHGRGKYKVCIADFNIDFGDVMATLSYDPDRFCMTNWADEIREKLDALPRDAYGNHTKEQLESIQYTDVQMERWLQKNNENGLYALLAPTSNEDSMDISEEELKVMMHNLIYNGGFDFVICDTGNNTRDSSYMALMEADQVFLVVTQNFNTMNCNNSVLSTLYKVKFDMSKINLIVNKVKPKKSVGIGMDEVAEALKNPDTGRPYPCVAKIKDTNDIKQANNNAEPLVYNPSHEFTKSIGQLVSKIVGDDFVLEQPKKKSFLARLFGSK